MGTCVSLQCSLTCCIGLEMPMFYKYPAPSQVPLQLRALLSLPFLKWWSAPCCLVFLTPYSILPHSSLPAHPTHMEVSAMSFWVKPANPDCAASDSVDRSPPSGNTAFLGLLGQHILLAFPTNPSLASSPSSLPGPTMLALWGSV